MPSFMAYSAGPSSGQDFRVQGQGKFSTTAAQIEAMSLRFKFVGKDVAMDALPVMEEEIVKYVDPSSGAGFKFSVGRIAATIGTWKPELIKDPEAEQQAITWAEENGVGYDEPENPEGENNWILIENGAYKAVKRYRGSVWTAEVGTFTPYAGLVEDGGSMPIHPFKNTKVVVIATWPAHQMFARGMFDAQSKLGSIIEGRVKKAM